MTTKAEPTKKGTPVIPILQQLNDFLIKSGIVPPCGADVETYAVRDVVSHRSYSIRKFDIARMQMSLAGAVLVLKRPIRKNGRIYLRVSDRTLDLLGLAIRGR